jgi:ADP-ribose pyrophosphatase YjhB (NUDIX family)
MRFCPDCGVQVERRVPAGDNLERHVCPACGAIHYVNPKVVVGAVCHWRGPTPERDKVLLCKRAIEPRTGYWAVPAGYLEVGESSEAGAAREAFEEANARIEITGLLGVYNVVRIAQVQLFYAADLLSPAVAAGPETAELDLFDWDAIPWAELAFPSVGWVLQRAREVKRLNAPYPTLRGP